MPSLYERGFIVITIRREIPNRAGWAKDKTCRVLAGCYEMSGPRVREVYVPEQVGEIQGWGYCEWKDKKPLAVKLYVAVRPVGKVTANGDIVSP